METWFLIITTLCIAALLKALLSSISQPKSKPKWPPGPQRVPIITTIRLLRQSSTEALATLRSLCSKFGPIVTLRRGPRPLIFISGHDLAHEALIKKGAIFADRPKALPAAKIINSNQHSISSAGYGSTWRLLRRNLTSQILHPSKVKEFSHARKWVLNILLTHLKQAASSANGVVKVVDHFRFAMFCLLVLMCFGDKLDESKIKEIEKIQHRLLVSLTRFQVLNYWPRLTRILFHKRWNELFSLRSKQEEVLTPIINSRKASIEQDQPKGVTSYVDTLLTLELQDEDGNKRKLTEEELVSVCSEFLNAGTDTTSTALQWILANLIKHPDIQSKLYEEIKGVLGETTQVEEVSEEELPKMPYLKAVVLEGLRRHPPGQLVLPHSVTQEVELGGYTIPKNAVVNFLVADIGWDAKVWEDPMEFKPERFLSNIEFDITGSREIKMMPFGAGRRICPGFGLAMLHLQYFVANLVWNFKWEAVDGVGVDLSEKQEFTTVMKNPLHACITPR